MTSGKEFSKKNLERKVSALFFGSERESTIFSERERGAQLCR